MATSMHFQRPSYLGEDYIDMAHVQLTEATEPLPEIEPLPLTWWQEWFPILAPNPARPDEPLWYRLFPFLADWLPWLFYYRDLAVYHVQRVFYVINYYVSYTAWTIGRHKDAAHYYSQRFLYDLDDRLRRWADRLEAQQGYGPLVEGNAGTPPEEQVYYTEDGQPYYAEEAQPYYTEEELAAYYAQLEAAGQIPPDYLQPIPAPGA